MKAIINANVFDGKSEQLKKNSTIVIDNGLVKEITQQPVSLEQFEEVIDAENKVVMPGLTDAHMHLAMSYGMRSIHDKTFDQIAVRSTVFAKEVLMRGFTCVRDAGGPVFGLKDNIDAGLIPGPRIFPSYGMLSQTTGHGDFRTSRAEQRTELGQHTAPVMRIPNDNVICDGVAEVLRGAREQLFMGASQIKIHAGGGIASHFDPIFGVQFTLEEMQAAVQVAKNSGTYVMAHIYTPAAMQQAAKAGVMSFEHGTMLDEETAKIVSDKGIWMAPQPQFDPLTDPGDRTPDQLAKRKYMELGQMQQTELILKYDIPIVYGTDLFREDNGRGGDRQNTDLVKYQKRFGNMNALRSATGNIYELTKLTTYMNPYAKGKVGVLEEGSFADLLIVEGDPTVDMSCLADVDNIKLIMKDGKVYKDIL